MDKENGRVPLWHKTVLSLEEAAEYTGIGINTLRRISDTDNCPFVLWIGNKRTIKREVFDEYIRDKYSI